jgi:hypothetical protein
MKYASALESNKAYIFILLKSIFNIIGTLKQGEASEIKIKPLNVDCAIFSNRMVLIVAWHLCFPIQHSPPLIEHLLKGNSKLWVTK